MCNVNDKKRTKKNEKFDSLPGCKQGAKSSYIAECIVLDTIKEDGEFAVTQLVQSYIKPHCWQD
jgi:hypothetical protein